MHISFARPCIHATFDAENNPSRSRSYFGHPVKAKLLGWQDARDPASLKSCTPPTLSLSDRLHYKGRAHAVWLRHHAVRGHANHTCWIWWTNETSGQHCFHFSLFFFLSFFLPFFLSFFLSFILSSFLVLSFYFILKLSFYQIDGEDSCTTDWIDEILNNCVLWLLPLPPFHLRRKFLIKDKISP